MPRFSKDQIEKAAKAAATKGWSLMGAEGEGMRWGYHLPDSCLEYWRAVARAALSTIKATPRVTVEEEEENHMLAALSLDDYSLFRLTLFWKKEKNGGHWRVTDKDGKILGFVRRVSPGSWDAYICTGKKWPESDQCINIGLQGRDLYRARRDVEGALFKRSKGDT